MGALGVTEWENLGYKDSDMMGRAGNQDARCFWQADLDEAIGRLVFLVRTYRPDVITTYNDFGGYGHPDHIRTHVVGVGAFARAGDPSWYPEQLAPEHGGTGAPAGEGGLAPWAPAKLYEQAMPASVRVALKEKMEAIGERSFWSPPEDATPEQLAEFEAYVAKILIPDDVITTWIDIDAYLRFMAEMPVGVHWPVVHRARELRAAGMPIALLTNNVAEWGDHWRATFPVDELFEVVIDSSAVRMRKPDHRIYLLTCDEVGVAPDACVFVDDNADNIAAARALGMETVHFGEDPFAAMDELDAILERRGPII